jgi:signal transduction histidine kinase
MAQLQEAEVLRQNMVADVAHELRTPLSVLQGNLWAILNDAYPLERAWWRHRAVASGLKARPVRARSFASRCRWRKRFSERL